MPKFLVSFYFLAVSLYAPFADSCTTIAISTQDHMLVAKNLDWEVKRGTIFINPSGVEKVAGLLPENANRLKWTSHFSSITFSHKGLGFPTEGMNEEGLSVDTMQLTESIYPPPTDSLPAASPNQWVQYILDTSKNVPEAIQNAKRARIIGSNRDSHYMVCDASTGCATFEYQNGILVIHSGRTLPYRVLTNSSYESSKTYMDLIVSQRKEKVLIDGEGSQSLDRFARAAIWSQRATVSPSAHSNLVNYSFDALKSVARPDTAWSIVFDLREKRVHFRTLRNRGIRSVDLTKLAFDDCHAKAKMLDVETPLIGDVTNQFAAYSESKNRELGQANRLLTPTMRGEILSGEEYEVSTKMKVPSLIRH